MPVQRTKDDSGRASGLIIGSTAGASIAVSMILFVLFAASGIHAVPQLKGLYVIYYGPLIGSEGNLSAQAQRILDSKPSLAIIAYSGQSDKDKAAAVIKQFKQAGIKVLTYTWTDYGSRNLNQVKADILSQLGAGADGIFVDEVTNIGNDREFAYYSAIYHTVKDYNQTRIVVMNPGRYNVSQSVMGISDILSLEEDWVLSGHIPWKQQYPSSKFMGVSSNEYCHPACVSQSNAENMTSSAWNAGIGYHFSTDRYTELPSWYSKYMYDMHKISS